MFYLLIIVLNIFLIFLETILVQNVLLKFGFVFSFVDTMLLTVLFRCVMGIRGEVHKEGIDFIERSLENIMSCSFQLGIAYACSYLIWG